MNLPESSSKAQIVGFLNILPPQLKFCPSLTLPTNFLFSFSLPTFLSFLFLLSQNLLYQLLFFSFFLFFLVLPSKPVFSPKYLFSQALQKFPRTLHLRKLTPPPILALFFLFLCLPPDLNKLDISFKNLSLLSFSSTSSG